jgi:hypothetical protein
LDRRNKSGELEKTRYREKECPRPNDKFNQVAHLAFTDPIITAVAIAAAIIQTAPFLPDCEIVADAKSPHWIVHSKLQVSQMIA